MSLTIASVSSSIPELGRIQKDLDIVEENAQVIQIVRSVFEGIIAAKTQALIEEYLFVDLTRIYKEAGIVFDYIPKSLVPRRAPEDLTAAKRESRVLLGSKNSDILSRLLREFAYGQTEMAQEPKKAFIYKDSDLFDRATTLTKVGRYSVGACTCVGNLGRDIYFKIWDEGRNQDRYTMEELNLTIGDRVYSMPFVAVFDGHGKRGAQVSEYASRHLKTVLLMTLKQHNPVELSHRGIWNALKLVCVNLNKYWASSFGVKHSPGTTVLFFIELMDMVYVVNLGHSRGALNNNGMFIQLTDDAIPQKDRFKKSIENRGGQVFYNGLDGGLSTARAVGNLDLGAHVSARSKIMMLPSSFLEMGSDVILFSNGVYEVASTAQILQADEEHHERSPDLLAKDLVFSSFAAHSKDHLTAIVIRKGERT